GARRPRAIPAFRTASTPRRPAGCRAGAKRNRRRPRHRRRSTPRPRSAPARPGAPWASGTAARRAGWPAALCPCARRGGCRTRTRADRAPSSARCAPRAGHRRRRWPPPSPWDRARPPPRPRRTAGRRSPVLPGTDRRLAFGYCGAMSPTTHPSHAHAFDSGFVRAVLDDLLDHGARVYGITGPQGCGKSTLAAQLAGAAAGRGLRMACVSIDDFYLGHVARQKLAAEVHPLLATRGPPGTHDAAMACEVLDALREGRPAQLPRFDKITDRRLPRTQWPLL